MCMTPATLEAAATSTAPAEDFETRLIDAYNDAAMVLMISLGHRTGLFAAMADAPPLTSAELAGRARLVERYVREWLGALVVSGVVEFDPAHSTYRLPPEHAALLTDGGSANLAVFAQYIPLLGTVEDDVARCFRDGGGVPYSRYTRFHEVMAQDSGQTVLPALFEHILPLAAGLGERLAAGVNVLDVGCGRGRALLLMAQRFPNSHFTGYDLSADAVVWAQEQARRQGLGNLRFETRDLSDFENSATPGAFDFVTTFDAVHDQARPLAVLKGIFRTLKSGGVYLMQDIHASSHVHNNCNHPLGTLLYTISCMHCMTVSLAQGGDGLGAMWGREHAETLLRTAGFEDVAVHQLAHDVQNDYYVMHKH